jgi:hypothetical protein
MCARRTSSLTWYRKSKISTDLVISLVLLSLSAAMMIAWFAFAVHHDCKPNPPLRSKTFGYEVPIESICKAWKGLINV